MSARELNMMGTNGSTVPAPSATAAARAFGEAAASAAAAVMPTAVASAAAAAASAGPAAATLPMAPTPKAPARRVAGVLAWAAALVVAAMIALAPRAAFADEARVTADLPVRCAVQAPETASGDSAGANASGAAAAADERFSFELSAACEGAPMPQDSVLSLTGAGEGSFSIDYTQAQVGTWEYELRQVPGTAEGWTYDDAVYRVKVHVFWYDETYRQLVAKVVYINDATGQKSDPLFENTPPAPVAVPASPNDGDGNGASDGEPGGGGDAVSPLSAFPQTGDAWGALFAAAAGVAVVAAVVVLLAVLGAKRRNHEQA